MPQRRNYKAVNFDLDTSALRNRFGESGRSGAYSKIRSYMESNGFEHRQGSGYRSIKTMSEAETVDLIVDMYRQLDWLSDCVQKLDVTNIGREYDLHSIAKARLAHEKQVFIYDVYL